jgi:hypothetical protein
MLKFIIASLILIHGLIHLMGFVKAFKLSEIDMLTLSISKPAGLLWLVAAVLCIVTAVVFISGEEWWWMIALPAMILSQLLIILYWQDAKFGTIANLIIMTVAILEFGIWNFNSRVKTELKSFMAIAGPVEKKPVTDDMLSNLPAVVKLWLQRSNVIGRGMIHSVYLKQAGEMRSAPGGKWMPLTAEQWFTPEKPGFIWVGRINAGPGIQITARDKYEQGKGQMLIKLLSLYTIADVTGKETDQSTMLRYLAETFWFPSAALSNYIQWKEVDSLTARAVMTYAGISDSALIKFDTNGDMVSFETWRYYDRKSGATLEDWLVQVEPGGYREFEGIRIPAISTVTWKLKEGDFTWLKLKLTEVHYNKID